MILLHVFFYYFCSTLCVLKESFFGLNNLYISPSAWWLVVVCLFVFNCQHPGFETCINTLLCLHAHSQSPYPCGPLWCPPLFHSTNDYHAQVFWKTPPPPSLYRVEFLHCQLNACLCWVFSKKKKNGKPDDSVAASSRPPRPPYLETLLLLCSRYFPPLDSL